MNEFEQFVRRQLDRNGIVLTSGGMLFRSDVVSQPDILNYFDNDDIIETDITNYDDISMQNFILIITIIMLSITILIIFFGNFWFF